VKSNSEKIKVEQIKIWTLCECQWNTFHSSKLRNRISVAKCVLERIFETGEREREPYVKRIASWQRNVLGLLDKRLEGKGRDG